MDKPLEINTSNTTSKLTAIGETEGYLKLEGNIFNSLNNISPYLRVYEYVDFVNNVFKQRVTMNNIVSYSKFIGNEFKDGLTFSGTSSTLTNVDFMGNTFNYTTTKAALNLESRGASTGCKISDNNIFNQTSGAEAILIWEGSGGTHSDYKVFGTRLVEGGATEFMYLTIDDSSIYDNIDVNTCLVDQTITIGTGGVANRVN